jgi:hypothetical protein
MISLNPVAFLHPACLIRANQQPRPGLSPGDYQILDQGRELPLGRPGVAAQFVLDGQTRLPVRACCG